MIKLQEVDVRTIQLEAIVDEHQASFIKKMLVRKNKPTDQFLSGTIDDEPEMFEPDPEPQEEIERKEFERLNPRLFDIKVTQ